MKLAHRLVSKVLGRNLASTPKDVIIDQMLEPRPLPMGRKDFEDWSDRILSGALIPGGEADPETFQMCLKSALANMIIHLGPTESHKPDAFFIHQLRKSACNQVAFTVFQELQPIVKARTAAKEAALKATDEVKAG